MIDIMIISENAMSTFCGGVVLALVRGRRLELRILVSGVHQHRFPESSRVYGVVLPRAACARNVRVDRDTWIGQ